MLNYTWYLLKYDKQKRREGREDWKLKERGAIKWGGGNSWSDWSKKEINRPHAPNLANGARLKGYMPIALCDIYLIQYPGARRRSKVGGIL